MDAGLSPDTVLAAGGVVIRRRKRRLEVAVVHRDRYDDWTLPKGKLDAGESPEEAALREVEEETGLHCRLERKLKDVEYVDNRGRQKRVSYWLMTPLDGRFKPSSEVDELRWVRRPKARKLLTYDHDRELLDLF
ncbi:MAG TPA: NUDIX hydrolase [Candidatus Acidoferrales bacterium]|nr:NUDIX hydrolase [Candidatus Acidoferrales bacterium]